MQAEQEDRFQEFVRARWSHLVRTAYLLTGDAHHAEDLTQTALAKAYRSWRRVSGSDNPEAYVRRMLVTCNSDRFRKRRVKEALTDAPPDGRGGTRPWRGSRSAGSLLGALAQLPPRQRAVVVLRYWEDLSEAEVGRGARLLAGHGQEPGVQGSGEVAYVSGAGAGHGDRAPQGRHRNEGERAGARTSRSGCVSCSPRTRTRSGPRRRRIRRSAARAWSSGGGGWRWPGRSWSTLAAVPVGAYAVGGGGDGDGPTRRRHPRRRRAPHRPPRPAAQWARADRDGRGSSSTGSRWSRPRTGWTSASLGPAERGPAASAATDLGKADDYRIILALNSTGDSNAPGDGVFVVAVKEKPARPG